MCIFVGSNQSNDTAMNHFTVTPEGRISGPKDYMDARFRTYMDTIESGRSVLFNEAIMRSPNMETAIAVCLETDYNQWKNTARLAQGVY